MARYSHASRGTVVGTNLRAMLSLFGVAGVGPRVLEIGVFNTTATALAVAVARFTNATGVGAGLAETAEIQNANAAQCTVFAGHTADGGVGGIHRQATLNGSAGAGVIWTFSGSGLEVPVGTGNGVGIIVPTGTGQLCDLYIVWEE